MTDTETPVVTPEEVAATAPDEADDAPQYDIQPSTDPDEWPQDEVADEPEDVQPNAITAFLVVVGADGSAFATSELAKLGEILPAREATIPDMRRACQEVVHDINAMQTSQQTVGLMQQSAQQLAEQARNEKIAAKLASKGIQVPGRR